MEKQFLYSAYILLPKKYFEKWSVIACDQYTSEPEYWAETEEIVGENASALRIILPEAYLTDDDSEKIAEINKNMIKYLNSDVFNLFENTIIYTKRTLKNGVSRHGIVGLIDLEDYSYEKGASTPIRATEQTVIERIPPRVAIRRDASIELPHVMLLIDDEKRTVIEPISENTDSYEKIYDFELMQNAGHICGYALSDDAKKQVESALEMLYENSKDGLLYAVGDGNHSLASAKECYRQGCGPRYALVEIVNIHDYSLEFEPIYRVVFGGNQKLIDDFISYCGKSENGDGQKFLIINGEKEQGISLNAKGTLPVATLQGFLDEYIKNTNLKIDYIHGIENVKKLCKRENAIGFIFDGMEKNQLFEAVSNDGSLPRKTFSMGCADDKRFYLEARKIK